MSNRKFYPIHFDDEMLEQLRKFGEENGGLNRNASVRLIIAQTLRNDENDQKQQQ